MNLHALRLFYVAADEGSITKASQKLKISQPAVTAQIKAFEASYGTDLFVRKGRDISLTPLGLEVYQEAEHLFRVENRIETLLSSNKRSLRINGTRLVMNHFLPHFILSFQNKFPDTQVTINHHHSHQVIDNMLNYEYDLGFIGAGPNFKAPKNLKAIPVKQDPLVFIAHKDHPLKNRTVSPDELSQYHFFSTESGSNLRKQLTQISKHFEVSMTFSDVYELLAYLSHDASAVSLCSMSVVEQALRAGTVIEIKTDFQNPMNQIFALVRERDANRLAIVQFLDALTHK